MGIQGDSMGTRFSTCIRVPFFQAMLMLYDTPMVAVKLLLSLSLTFLILNGACKDCALPSEGFLCLVQNH